MWPTIRTGTNARRTNRDCFEGNEEQARRLAESEGKGALCGPVAVSSGSARWQNHSRGMAVEAKLVRRVYGRSDHQPWSSALHGKANASQDDRGQGEPRFADITA